MPCAVYWLTMVGFEEAYNLQMKLVRRRQDGLIADTLLLLEHPPTITLGKSGKRENVLVPPERLKKEGIALCRTDRGGDVTYHGPRQLVAYPIINLRESQRNIHRYVYDLEEVLIKTLDSFGIKASRDYGHPGVWVERQEIAAIGLNIKHGISMHGLALNVNPNLEHFSFINPCGFSDRKATSMAKLLGHELRIETVAETLVSHFADVLKVRVEWSSNALLMSHPNI
jgi:lipoyl(octanoyl) transferase